MAKTSDEEAVRAKIAELAPWEAVAERLHELIMETVPDLEPRLWYGMPGYAKSKSSPVLCHFRVDDGLMTFAITEKADLTPPPDATTQLVESAWFVNGIDEATEARIVDVLRRHVA